MIVHLVLAAVVLSAFARAPFQHRHDSDSHHEHQGQHHANHLHLSDEDDYDGPTVNSNHRAADARLIDWLAGDGKLPGKVLPDLPTEVFRIEMPREQAIISSVVPSHNHDPPWRFYLNPRSPPV